MSISQAFTYFRAMAEMAQSIPCHGEACLHPRRLLHYLYKIPEHCDVVRLLFVYGFVEDGWVVSPVSWWDMFSGKFCVVVCVGCVVLLLLRFISGYSM